MQGMDAKEKGRAKGGSQDFLVGVFLFWELVEDLKTQKKDERRIDEVKDQVVQVINPGFQAADLKIERERKPGEGDIKAEVALGEDPLQGIKVQVADRQIVLNVVGVVPIHE